MIEAAILLVAALLAASPAYAQTPAPAANAAAAPATLARSAPSIGYGQRRGATRVTLAGSAVMPRAEGEAKVEATRGATRIDVRVDGMLPASAFGSEYLTYILWAISPEGRPFNLGELQLQKGRSGLSATTPLQTFALIVTAEPYYAVRQPSDTLVLQNQWPEASGTSLSYEAVRRGAYVAGAAPASPPRNTKLPAEYFQARNAVRIAQASGVERYAADSWAALTRQMQRIEELSTQRRVDDRAVTAAARELIQSAEDARDLALRRAADARIEAERTNAARREAEARQRAADEEARRARAEAEREAADRARQQALAGAERQRLSQEAAARAEAERARQAALESDRRIQALTREREQLRAQLLQQLNAVFETQDTARGLVASMSDVTFATGQATLQPDARERLAQVSGILVAHPTLRLEIEGHTDSVGSDELNQQLSERRAGAVRTYLLQRGVSEERMVARGFGETRPVASNDTADGRRKNRRVELVVSGEAIGGQ